MCLVPRVATGSLPVMNDCRCEGNQLTCVFVTDVRFFSLATEHVLVSKKYTHKLLKNWLPRWRYW